MEDDPSFIDYMSVNKHTIYKCARATGIDVSEKECKQVLNDMGNDMSLGANILDMVYDDIGRRLRKLKSGSFDKYRCTCRCHVICDCNCTDRRVEEAQNTPPTFAVRGE